MASKLMCSVGVAAAFIALSAPAAPAYSIIANVPVGSAPAGVAVTPHNRLIYVANQLDSPSDVSVIDPDTNSVIATVPIPFFRPLWVCASPHTDRVYIGTASGGLAILEGTRLAHTIPVGVSPAGPAVDPQGNRIYVADYNADTVWVIQGMHVVTGIPVGHAPNFVAINTQTHRIYASNLLGGTVSVINGQTNAVIDTITVGIGPAGITVDPRTNRIYVAEQGSGDLVVIDGATDTVIATVSIAFEATGVALNPFTNAIYVTDFDGNVWVVDEATNTVRTSIGGFSGALGVAIDPLTDTAYVTDVGAHSLIVIADAP